MHIENTFPVDASADSVFAFLLDVNSVMGCVPGAELSEVVDPDTFRGRVRIRVGPITITYHGTGHVVSRDDAARTAVLEAEGREAGGSGSARAAIALSVTERDGGADVTLHTDFTVVGRAAQFGQGIVEDVSRGLLAQMGACIGARLAAPVVLPDRLPTTILSAEPEEPVSAMGRVLAMVRGRSAALAPLGGAAAALLTVAVLLRVRRRR